MDNVLDRTSPAALEGLAVCSKAAGQDFATWAELESWVGLPLPDSSVQRWIARAKRELASR